MAKENVIPGLRQKQVLRRSHLSSENKVPGSLVGLPKDLWDEEYFKDGMWKSKPRKRPLIGIMYSILNTHDFSTLSGKNSMAYLERFPRCIKIWWYVIVYYQLPSFTWKVVF